MVLDRVENLNQYQGLGEHFRTAIAYALSHDLTGLASGRVEVDGENVFIMVNDRTLSQEPRQWELHKRYADLQLIVRGRERIGYHPSKRLEDAAYDAQADCALTENLAGQDFCVAEGAFAIFLPGEWHKPFCPVTPGERSIKCVFKIRV